MRAIQRDTRVRWTSPTAELMRVMQRAYRYNSIQKKRNGRNK